MLSTEVEEFKELKEHKAGNGVSICKCAAVIWSQNNDRTYFDISKMLYYFYSNECRLRVVCFQSGKVEQEQHGIIFARLNIK